MSSNNNTNNANISEKSPLLVSAPTGGDSTDHQQQYGNNDKNEQEQQEQQQQHTTKTRREQQQEELERTLLERIPNLSNMTSGVATYSHPLTSSYQSPSIYNSSTNQYHNKNIHRQQGQRPPPIPQQPSSSSQQQQQRGHHRRYTSLSNFIDIEKRRVSNFHNFATDIVQQTATDVKTTFQNDINATRHGKLYFLDMTMTRSLSVVPENLQDFLQEAIQDFNFTNNDLIHQNKIDRHPLHRDEISIYLDNDDDNVEEASDIDTTRSTKQHKQKRKQQVDGYYTELSIDEGQDQQEEQEQEEGQAESSDTTTKDTSPGSILSAYLGLLVAVIAVSSNGTALTLLEGVDPCIKLFWRMTATALLLSFFAIRSMIRQYYKYKALYYSDNNNDDNNSNNDYPMLTTDGTNDKTSNILRTLLGQIELNAVIEFICAVTAFTIHTILYFYAFKYTSIGNAVIFANSQALLLIVAKACIGEQVLLIETIGVIVAFTGAMLCCADSDRPISTTDESIVKDIIYTNGTIINSTMIVTTEILSSTSAAQKTTTTIKPVHDDVMFENLFGDALALGAAVTGVIYLTFAKAVRKKMKTTIFMFLVMVFGSLLVLLYMTCVGIEYYWNRHPTKGLFGWISFKTSYGSTSTGPITVEFNHFIVLVYIAVICNICGTMGFVRAMKFFDNLIIAVATLLEPMIATFIAYMFNVGMLPGWLGWTGNILVAVGTFGVVYPSIQSGKDAGH